MECKPEPVEEFHDSLYQARSTFDGRPSLPQINTHSNGAGNQLAPSAPMPHHLPPTPTDLKSYLSLLAAEQSAQIASQSTMPYSHEINYSPYASAGPASCASSPFTGEYVAYDPRSSPYYTSDPNAFGYPLGTAAYPPMTTGPVNMQPAHFVPGVENIVPHVLQEAPLLPMTFAPGSFPSQRSYSSHRSSPVPSDSEASLASINTSSSRRSSVSTTSSTRSRNSKEKRYFCEECGEGFARNFNLKSHISCKHKGEKPFACSCCSKTFSRKHDTARHLTARHGYSGVAAAADVNTRYPTGAVSV